jgi:hypothetical protein
MPFTIGMNLPHKQDNAPLTDRDWFDVSENVAQMIGLVADKGP